MWRINILTKKNNSGSETYIVATQPHLFLAQLFLENKMRTQPSSFSIPNMKCTFIISHDDTSYV